MCTGVVVNALFLRRYRHIWDNYFAGISAKMKWKWLFFGKKAAFFESTFYAVLRETARKKKIFGAGSQATTLWKPCFSRADTWLRWETFYNETMFRRYSDWPSGNRQVREGNRECNAGLTRPAHPLLSLFPGNSKPRTYPKILESMQFECLHSNCGSSIILG